MRTVAIINQKGGCGKTTTSINLAACLARLGHKTLLVDMDPQGHCGVGLAVPEEQVERTIYETLIEPGDGKPADIGQVVWQIASDFDLAPSNLRLAAFEQVFSNRAGRDERLRRSLEKVKNNYEWCVIDCPPSVGLLTFNALKACDQVIVPVETGYFSLHGLAKMMETLEVMRKRCGQDILIRILPTLYDTRTKLAREVLSELRAKFKGYLMESAVNFNTKLKEAASFGQPITEYDPGSRGYRDFVNLARELMGQTLAMTPPAVDEQLSRPQELVQRARQLSQLASSQFGRHTAAQTPFTQAPARPAPAAQPAPRAATLTLDLGEFGPTGRLSSFDSKIVDIGPLASSYVSSTPVEPPQHMMRLTASSWPTSAELALPNRQVQTSSMSHSGSKASAVKTIAQKIEEFYGVKQIGAEVLFAAHFENARRVFLAGDFNNWTPQSTPMTLGDRPGTFRKTMPLLPGRYKYRLVVDGKWVTDPNNNYVEVNQFGELDNVIEVAQANTALAA